MPRSVLQRFISILLCLTHEGYTGAGAIVGPTIGTTLWRARHRSINRAIDAKDTEFFHRIAKNRVDASLQSPTQPVPDYYGIYYRWHLRFGD